MDEAGARAVLERVVSGEVPPARIDIGLAMRKGRTRRRWRLAAIVGGVPAVAAIAAVTVIVSGALPVWTSGPVAAHRSAAAPHRFNPLIPYASFGWLPPGKHITSAYTSAASEDLEVGPTGSPRSWDFMIYTAGSCDHTSGQLLSLLGASRRPTTLKCTLNWGASGGGHPTLANPVSAVAPSVHGHRAFWARPVCNTGQCNLAAAMLVWSYAPGGWARLSGPSRSDALKIARKVMFGAPTAQPIRFPVTITGVKPSWRVTMVQSAPSGEVLAAQQWTLGTAATAPSFTVLPKGPNGGLCNLQPASAVQRQIINGFRVTTTLTDQASQACAPRARGMSVYISTGAKMAPDAIAIFAHHLRLLGPNPAGWTTQPLG